MFLLKFGVPRSCFGVAMIWYLSKDWIWRSPEIYEDQFQISKELKVYAKHDPVSCWKKTRMLSMKTQLSRGKDGISHHEFDSHLRRSQNVDDDHNSIHREGHEDVIDPWYDQTKVMWSRRSMEPSIHHKVRKQPWFSRKTIWCWKFDVSLAHR